MAHRNRRSFLAASAATLAVPTILPRSVFGANEKVVTGHIGVKNQGTPNLKAFLKRATPAALCDADRDVLGAAAELAGKEGARVTTHRDFREVLDRKDVDAVVVSTPDHWHALMTALACQAGKDVYCEKPLSLTVAEGRKMVDAARRNGRVVQTGSQQRSDARFRRACEVVRSGRLGDLKTVLVGIPGVNWSPPPVTDGPPPPNLDFDAWLGPAPKVAYNAKHVHYNFRFYWDYSGGQTTNFGAHHLDVAQWALGADGSGPSFVEGRATFEPHGWYDVPSSCRVYLTYPKGVTVVLAQKAADVPGGVTFLGSKGTLFVDRTRIEADPKSLLDPPSAGDVALEVSGDHHQNFLDCVKTRAKPVADVEIGHRSATVCHLANVAMRLGRRLEWDPSSETFRGDAGANAMLDRPYRPPWSL